MPSAEHRIYLQIIHVLSLRVLNSRGCNLGIPIIHHDASELSPSVQASNVQMTHVVTMQTYREFKLSLARHIRYKKRSTGSWSSLFTIKWYRMILPTKVACYFLHVRRDVRALSAVALLVKARELLILARWWEPRLGTKAWNGLAPIWRSLAQRFRGIFIEQPSAWVIRTF